MEFIKRNLFLVIVAAVTVIVGTVLLISSYGKAGTVSAAAALRERAANELENLARSKANFLTVRAEMRRVKAVKERAREVSAKMVEWNSKRFGTLKVPKRDAANKVEMVPAFPIDRKVYNRYALDFEVTKKYIEELHGLLKELEATRPPTDEEIQAEVDKARQRIEASGRGRVMNATRDEAARLGGDAAFGDRGVAPPGPTADQGGAIRAPTARDTAKNIDAQAKKEGFETAVLFRSRAGVTYATLGSFDMVFPVERVGATDTELWHSFVNLLVQKDIVGAIRETNDMALRRDAANPVRPQVSAAAVKRLISVDVNENYYVSSFNKTFSPSKRKKTRRRPGGPGGPGGPDYMEGPGQFGGTGGPSVAATTGEKGIALTGRSTNKKFEVIHYNFTVIMPTRYLPSLMKNLQSLSYHTIIKIDLSAPGAAATGRSAGRAKNQPGGDRYYFGTDPVMKVTIYGEFVMLSDWSRGRWNPDKVVVVDGRKKKGAWSDKYPPLMPVAVLKGLYAHNPDILRPEDMTRLQQPPAGKRY